MRLTAAVAIVLLVATPATGVTFSDGTFVSANWTTTIFTFNHAGASTGQSTSDGNPGSHRLITTLQAGLLDRVCVDISRWRRPERPPFRAALSLWARPLTQPDFVDMLRRILTETGVDPHLLEIELSDVTLMQDATKYLPRLEALKALGVGLTVSDFGVGYSSLSYLRRCPVERLKIARSLVGNIPDDEHDSTIVTAIIRMAHCLGLQVVADGVTAERQLTFLRERACEDIQGDYVGRAVPAGDITRLIEQGETRGCAVTA